MREKWWPAARHGLDNWLKYHETHCGGSLTLGHQRPGHQIRSGQAPVKCNDTHWRIQGGGQPGHGPTQSPGRGAIMSFPLKLPKSFYFYSSFFSKMNLGPSQKNSGLNPWSFEFWRCPRLEPRAKLPPPPPPKKTGGWICQWWYLSYYFTNKKTSSAIIDLAFFWWTQPTVNSSIRYFFLSATFFRRALTKLKVTLRNPPLVVGTKNIRNRLFFLLNRPRVSNKGDSHRECSGAN